MRDGGGLKKRAVLTAVARALLPLLLGGSPPWCWRAWRVSLRFSCPPTSSAYLCPRASAASSASQVGGGPALSPPSSLRRGRCGGRDGAGGRPEGWVLRRGRGCRCRAGSGGGGMVRGHYIAVTWLQKERCPARARMGKSGWALDQAARGDGGVPIRGGIQEMWRYRTKGHGLLGKRC